MTHVEPWAPSSLRLLLLLLLLRLTVTPIQIPDRVGLTRSAHRTAKLWSTSRACGSHSHGLRSAERSSVDLSRFSAVGRSIVASASAEVARTRSGSRSASLAAVRGYERRSGRHCSLRSLNKDIAVLGPEGRFAANHDGLALRLSLGLWLLRRGSDGGRRTAKGLSRSLRLR